MAAPVLTELLRETRHRCSHLLLGVAVLLACGYADAAGNAERGAYLTAAGGCGSCHTDTENDGEPFAGGHPLESPYGVFYAPNITPDKDTGIGTWTDAEFLAALRRGVSPDGSAYYPSFPYPSYAGMTEEDALDIRAYLATLAPVRRDNTPHDLAWYMPGRWAMGIWQWLFSPWEYPSAAGLPAAEQRGAYIVRHLGHCGECHTPRDIFGALGTESELAGSPKGSPGGGAPDLTPDPDRGIGRWSLADLEFFLELGMKPDGDFAGGGMAPVVDENTAQLTKDDRAAIAAFLRSLPPG